MSLLPIGTTEPIDTLLDESANIHRANPLEGHKIALRAHELSVAAGYTAGEAQSLFRAAASLRLLGRREEALTSISAAESKFAELNDSAGLVRCMNHRASLLRDAGSEREAILLFNDVIVRAEAIGQKEVVFSAYAGLVAAFEAIGDKLGVYESAENALRTALEIGSDRTIGIALCNAANAQLEFEHWTEAVALFEEALTVLDHSGDSDTAATALSNIGYAHWRAGRREAAVSAYEKSLEFSLTHSNPRLQLVSESCLGYLFADRGDRKRALTYIERSLADAQQCDFVAERAQALMKAADAYVLLSNKTEAITFYEQALEVTQGFSAVREEICTKLALLLAERGDHRAAYERLAERQSLAIEREQQERQYSIRSVLVRQELQSQREAHAKVLEEKRILEEQGRSRDRELTQLALSLAERYELLQTIREQLLSADGNTRAIVRAIDRHLEETDGWRTFEVQFQSIYSEFTASLLAQSVDLTPTELRICSLLKLGLSSKQISDILRTSTRTIEWHRTAIRKKLGLSTNDNLSTFLASLS